MCFALRHRQFCWSRMSQPEWGKFEFAAVPHHLNQSFKSRSVLFFFGLSSGDHPSFHRVRQCITLMSWSHSLVFFNPWQVHSFWSLPLTRPACKGDPDCLGHIRVSRRERHDCIARYKVWVKQSPKVLSQSYIVSLQLFGFLSPAAQTWSQNCSQVFLFFKPT